MYLQKVLCRKNLFFKLVFVGLEGQWWK